MARVLILDDEPNFLKLLSTVLERRGHECLGIERISALEGSLAEFSPDVLLLDVNLPDGNSLDYLHTVELMADPPQIVVITGIPDDEGAQRAISLGAWDYICKTDPVSRIILAVERAASFRLERKTAVSQGELRASGIIGNSQLLAKCLSEGARAAHSIAPVLITGETGTGKELLARAIHQSSDRAGGEFVVVDCAAIPSQLAESILFGHVKGAFTGADATHLGLVKIADGGTLFLDEVAEMPEEVQKRFLRVVQEKIFRPVGGTKEDRSDFRIMAATNKDLDKFVEEGRFREDLLHRLRSISIHLPPLREREGDAVLIAKAVLSRLGGGRAVKAMSPDFLEAIASYYWPGNVRELVQAVEASVTRSEGFGTLYSVHLPERVRARHFPEGGGGNGYFQPVQPHSPRRLLPFAQVREAAVRSVEKAYLSELMATTKGDVKAACDISGLGRSRLYGLLKEHGLSTTGSSIS